MAEAVLVGVAKSVLGQLSSPALKEFLLVWNSEKDLNRLRDTIQTITEFLHDAEQRESKEHLVKGWLSRLRSILYDADDLFDAVAARALQKKAMSSNTFKREVTLFFSKSNQLHFVIKTAHNIKAIRERLDDIKSNMLTFNFQPLKVEENFPLMNLNRDTHSFVDVKDVIGRDGEKEEIIGLLLSDQTCHRNLSVISVIGFGGLGKTTLAQLVYNDDRVQLGFDLCLWTCINYLSDLKLVLATLLKSKPHDLDLDQLQGRLRDSIGDKKFLLVLDDIWEEDASNWDKLKTLLNCGKRGSKVLATTRNTKVAECLESVKPHFLLNVLSQDNAWSLFEKMTFGDGESSIDHSGLVPLGKEIVRKCGRVPLALVTVGRMLRSREKDEKLWSSFIEKELPDVFGDDINNAKLMEVLKLSYNYLPHTFKYCFAYCAIYPKDHEFDKDELVYMWLAHGFLEPFSKKSLEEVGDECFFYMVDRCFFQEVKRDRKKGYLRYRCKMHDLLHDLAIQVAGTESGCFMGGDFGGMVERRTLRHISATWNPTFPLDKSAFSSHPKTLKTLVLYNDEEVERSSLNSVLAQFRVLRVLQLSRLEFDTLPDSFGDLIHLRYLDLSVNTELKTLPNSICKLHHLQTLILNDCYSLVELPPNFGKLGSLRHLLLDGCCELEYFPLGFEKLTALVTLGRLPVHQQNGGLRYLGCLDDLCGGITIVLPVKGWCNCIEDARNANMYRKHKLNGMTIEWIRDSTDEVSKEETQAVLEALKPHKNLQYLKIKGDVGDIFPSWVFSLSNLKELALEDCANLEYLEDNVRFDSFFPCLEILKLGSLPNFKGWWKETTSLGDNAPISVLPSLPRVSKVVIKACPKLIESMPLFKGIENLNLSRVSGEFVSKFIFNPTMSWSSSEPHHYSKLKKIKLSFIQGFSCLAKDTIKVLTSLESLQIKVCPNLRWVSASGLAYLTALQKLDLTGLAFIEAFNPSPKPAGVNILDMNNEKMGIKNELGLPWKALRKLRYLKVHWQKHLQDGLLYLTALEELWICYYRTHQIEADNECGGIMSWNDLKRLQRICIHYRIGDEDTGICYFPNWVQYLPCLKDLCLSSRKLHMSWSILANMKLQTLSFFLVQKVVNVDEIVVEQRSQLNSLDTLALKDTEDGSWLHEIPWKLFRSLRSIEISFIKKIGSIPNEMQHLASLQSLSMGSCCEGIKAIPNWMINLTSLKDLYMSGSTSALGNRCKPHVGEDWCLISHIPKIYIEWDDEGGPGMINIMPHTLS